MSIFGDIAKGVQDVFRGADEFFGGVFTDLFAFKFFDEPEPPEPPNIKQQIYGTNQPRQIIYGKARVGGLTQYISSNADESLDVVLVFADHPCEAVDEIYIDDTNINDDKFDGLVEYYVGITGSPPPSSSILYTQTDLNPARHQFNGLSFIYFRFQYDDEVFRSLPKIQMDIRGKNDIYDPRTDSSGYTTNHALCTLDFLTNYIDTEYDSQSWIDAANFADDSVAGADSTTEARYTANGALRLEGTRIDALKTLSSAGNLDPVYSPTTATWLAFRAEYSAPVGTINENDLIDYIKISTGNSKSQKFNTAKGTFIDPNQAYEPVDFIALSDPSYIEEDGQELDKKFDFQFHNTPTLSRRVAKVKLEKSRFGLRVTAKVRLDALQYNVGDRVYLDYERFGWNQDQVFRIDNIEWSQVDGVTLELSQDAAAIYSWEEGDAIGVEVPPITNLPDPRIVLTPSNLTISEELYFTNVDKIIKTRVILTWTKGGPSNRVYEVQANYDGQGWVTLSDYIVSESYEFTDALTGPYQFRVRAANSAGYKSPFISDSYTVEGKTAPPSDVIGFTGVTTPLQIELSWEPIEDIDRDKYEIRSGTSWENSTLIDRISGVSYKWELKPTGTERVFIKAIDTTGNYSENASEAQIIINPPSKPSSFSSSVIDNLVQLFWGESLGSFLIRDYELRRGNSLANSQLIGYVEGTFQLIQETEAGEFTYWVRARDVNDNKGEYRSVQVIVDQPPDFILLGNQSLDLDETTGSNFATEFSIAEYTADSTEWSADSTIITADIAASTDVLTPVKLGDTWNEHFESISGWTQPDFTADSDILGIDYPSGNQVTDPFNPANWSGGSDPDVSYTSVTEYNPSGASFVGRFEYVGPNSAYIDITNDYSFNVGDYIFLCCIAKPDGFNFIRLLIQERPSSLALFSCYIDLSTGDVLSESGSVVRFIDTQKIPDGYYLIKVGIIAESDSDYRGIVWMSDPSGNPDVGEAVKAQALYFGSDTVSERFFGSVTYQGTNYAQDPFDPAGWSGVSDPDNSYTSVTEINPSGESFVGRFEYVGPTGAMSLNFGGYGNTLNIGDRFYICAIVKPDPITVLQLFFQYNDGGTKTQQVIYVDVISGDFNNQSGGGAYISSKTTGLSNGYYLFQAEFEAQENFPHRGVIYAAGDLSGGEPTVGDALKIQGAYAGANVNYPAIVNYPNIINNPYSADKTTIYADAGYQSIRDLHINNGYPYYLQPTPMTAQTVNVVDFLGQLSVARIQATVNIEQVVGITDYEVTLGYSDDGVTYTDVPNVNELVAKDFRYVRVIIDYTNADDLSYMRLNDVRIKLDVKLRIDNGSKDILSTDTDGTEIDFNVDFVDVQSIVLTPNTTTPVYVGSNFQDVPNPTGFKGLAWDENGTRVDATVSWTARGI